MWSMQDCDCDRYETGCVRVVDDDANARCVNASDAGVSEGESGWSKEKLQ